jgi:hypothetical protein
VLVFAVLLFIGTLMTLIGLVYAVFCPQITPISADCGFLVSDYAKTNRVGTLFTFSS